MSGVNLTDEGPIVSRVMGFLAAMCFAIPTSAIVWFASIKELAFWGAPDSFISTQLFWLILGSFALVALIFPKLFPSMMGCVWSWFLKLHRWLW